ncbi:Transcriptional regulator, GntR family [Pseudonocardia sp. Ae717_Ps2]|nr:Transcriptional regulator, GntR family [Pseudonocardia sp. Ae717_Ps2]
MEAGEFQAGQWLPTVRQLAIEYAANNRTIAQATHQLRDEGYLVARSTAGWIVREQRSIVRSTRNRLSRQERRAGRGAFTTDCHEAGIEPDVSNDVRLQTAPDEVAAALGLDAGTEVCVRERIMRGDGEVLQLATSYLPRSITAGTLIEEQSSGPGGIYARLEEAGYELTRYTERVRIGRASEQEAREMQVSPGEPVYRLRRIAWSGERAVELNDITITGHRYELVYELPAE